MTLKVSLVFIFILTYRMINEFEAVLDN